jgi:hypothetical protein
MCDYSLYSVNSRPAKVGEKLSTRDFGTGTRGFAAADAAVAVCVLPGTELAFSGPVTLTECRGRVSQPLTPSQISDDIRIRASVFDSERKDLAEGGRIA